LVCGAAGSKEGDSVTAIDGYGYRWWCTTRSEDGVWRRSMASGSENRVSRPVRMFDVRMFDVRMFDDSLSTDARIIQHHKWRCRKRGGGEMGEKKRKLA